MTDVAPLCHLYQQVVAGVDRYLFGHSNFLWSYLAFSGVMRVASNTLGQVTRLQAMGLPIGEPAYAGVSQPQRQQTAARAPVAAAAAPSAQPGVKPKTKKRVKKADRGFAMSAGV